MTRREWAIFAVGVAFVAVLLHLAVTQARATGERIFAPSITAPSKSGPFLNVTGGIARGVARGPRALYVVGIYRNGETTPVIHRTGYLERNAVQSTTTIIYACRPGAQNVFTGVVGYYSPTGTRKVAYSARKTFRCR